MLNLNYPSEANIIDTREYYWPLGVEEGYNITQFVDNIKAEIVVR